MDLSSVINRLKANVKGVRQYGGAVDFAAVKGGSLRTTPAIFVLPGKEIPGPNTTGTQVVTQQITDTFHIVYAVRDVSDPHGHSAYDGGLATLRTAVQVALMGWIPFAGAQPCERGPGNIINMTDGIVYYSDAYRTNYIIEQ